MLYLSYLFLIGSVLSYPTYIKCDRRVALGTQIMSGMTIKSKGWVEVTVDGEKIQNGDKVKCGSRLVLGIGNVKVSHARLWQVSRGSTGASFGGQGSRCGGTRTVFYDAFLRPGSSGLLEVFAAHASGQSRVSITDSFQVKVTCGGLPTPNPTPPPTGLNGQTPNPTPAPTAWKGQCEWSAPHENKDLAGFANDDTTKYFALWLAQEQCELMGEACAGISGWEDIHGEMTYRLRSEPGLKDSMVAATSWVKTCGDREEPSEEPEDEMVTYKSYKANCNKLKADKANKKTCKVNGCKGSCKASKINKVKWNCTKIDVAICTSHPGCSLKAKGKKKKCTGKVKFDE